MFQIHIYNFPENTSEVDTLCQETMKSSQALPCLTCSHYVTKSRGKTHMTSAPDAHRRLNIETTLSSSSDLTVKCQQVINNKLAVHYQLIDRLQQIIGLRLGFLHLKAHFTERETQKY